LPLPLPLAVVKEKSCEPAPIGNERTCTPAELTVWVEFSVPEETVMLAEPVVRAVTKIESATIYSSSSSGLKEPRGKRAYIPSGGLGVDCVSRVAPISV